MADSNIKKNAMIFAPKTSQYGKDTLSESQIFTDPIKQFLAWFSEAQAAKISIPEAATISTASLPSGRVSSRVVLFKELDPRGFVIYSNWSTSKKNSDLRTNPWMAMSFFWKELERQVRIEGQIEWLAEEESRIYFATRPRDSKIGAWASPQSQIVASREELDDKVKEFTKRFEGVEDKDIPCPPFWGGIRIVPVEWEFWQGRHGRVHDRIVYRRGSEEEKFEINRIAP
ncbi:pyridoxamine 5'-phosphate oxidase [Nadsonia fulvescens var. elongata DSM 6958]|uniref:pyridoxal 5'-phosphate synthase n=1 Tax=Nadsonia fulvescens var. elongata DSM 6958 TaxID=857566 RepID=A0A1E3PHQ8_9ASCO|nr:pyridoxamine 5'-phosphate oxidase [Nadsonia fulvescens var. elongata DSM 6958]